MKPLGNEPALITGILNALLGLVVTLNVGLTSQEAGTLTVLVTAGFTAVAAALTRPIAPTAFTGLVTAGADALAAFHFELSGATVGAVNALVISVLMFINRGHVSPKSVGRTAAP
jgi:hypothetical protein